MDILVYSKDEYDYLKQYDGEFFKEIEVLGRVLYAK
jgi:hypothetical protein